MWNQLADILTKCNFTRDEWQHLLTLLNICDFSPVCLKTFSFASGPETMSQRVQEGAKEERIMAKPRPTMNLVSKTTVSSSTAQSSNTSGSPGTPRVSSQSWNLSASAGRLAAKDSSTNDKAWQPNVHPNESAGRPAAVETNRDLNLFPSAGRLAAKGSDIVDIDSGWPNHCQICAASVRHLEKVNLHLRRKIGRKPDDDLNDLDINTLIWRMFMSATLAAAVHRGTNYVENLFTFYQESGTTNKKAIVRRVEQIDPRTKRKFQKCQKLIGTLILGKD